MKKQKNSFKEHLTESILEIVLIAIFYGIGAGVIYLFGKLFKLNLDVFSMDADGVILLGVVALLVIPFIIAILVNTIKKIMKK